MIQSGVLQSSVSTSSILANQRLALDLSPQSSSQNNPIPISHKSPSIQTQGLSQSNTITNYEPWIFNSQYADPAMNNELKRISYFDLLHDTPPITRLFSSEYVDLVNNILNIQESRLEGRIDADHLSQLGFADISESPLIMNQGPSSISDAVEQEAAYSIFPQNPRTVEPSNNASENESAILYNHTHSPSSNTLKSRTIPRQQGKASERWHYGDVERHEYREDQTTHENNITKNIVKFAIKILNNLSLKLSKFV